MQKYFGTVTTTVVTVRNYVHYSIKLQSQPYANKSTTVYIFSFEI